MKTYQKVVFVLFGILLFFTPLALWIFTSEVFEFNKMVLVYIMTVLITGTWTAGMIAEKKFVFRRTILDLPLCVFIGSQVLATVFSIDPLTSFLGYYSRFNGGLASVICYSLLYWAFVSNIDAKRTIKLIFITLASATLVSIYGVLEHFGIDKNVWQQDVQSRVFSTLGQPNWLAAYLVALMPLAWSYSISNEFSKSKNKITNFDNKIVKFIISFGLSILLFWTLIFTKSRSGLLGVGVAYLAFWAGYFLVNCKEFKKRLVPFLVISSSLLVISLISGTQYTPSFLSLINRSLSQPAAQPAPGATSLETGGTESTTIRKIVWKGAIQVWLHYPIFGTGVETFAYSYYLFRPAEHNLTSEWDYIYNKAHNEFLNMAVNSGTVGILSYLALIGFSIYQILKLKSNNSNLITISKSLKSEQKKISDLSYGSELSVISFALFAGYISLLVTNFFGFSVVPTQIELFLFPAIAIALEVQSTEYRVQSNKLSTAQKVSIFLVLCTISYVLWRVATYWYADTLYAKGKAYNSAGQPDTATKYLSDAINLEPNQPLYIGGDGGIASSYAYIAVSLNQQKNTAQAQQFADKAISESDKAISLSPANLNLKRIKFGIYIMLSVVNPNYLLGARDSLISTIAQAPTDAKLYYNLGLTYARLGQINEAMETFSKTIELKANYREARLAYAILLANKGQNGQAKAQLEYILTNINPADSLAKQTLESIK